MLKKWSNYRLKYGRKIAKKSTQFGCWFEHCSTGEHWGSVRTQPCTPVIEGSIGQKEISQAERNPQKIL